VEAIRRYWPEFDLWLVPRYMGPTVWCARPKGERVATINEDSPEEFITALAEARASLDWPPG